MTAADGTRPRRRSAARPAAAPAPSGPPQTVLVQIRALLPSLAPAERRVAEAALADPANVAAQTISELAAECRTSETTVMRFCRTLGLKGYPDLRIGLASAASVEESSAGWSAVGADIGPRDSLADIVAKLGFADARAVEDTVGQLDLHALKRAVDAVSSADGIDVYGGGGERPGRPGPAAEAAPDRPPGQRLGGPAHRADLGGAAARRRRGDRGVAHRRHRGPPSRSSRRRGATEPPRWRSPNFPRSEITEHADHVLTTAVRETTFRSGAMASRIAALTVVDCLFVGVAQRHRAAR
ncbi:RpiR family transcriptional regulator [Streptomyces sp. TLI_171]|nr:MurR/RpiR family transcriptional regulator [Streptomyces sp. TLI_171]RKE05198.1 RpiR family transcriptional regulator [Streptomyces sp. TLI_171]